MHTIQAVPPIIKGDTMVPAGNRAGTIFRPPLMWVPRRPGRRRPEKPLKGVIGERVQPLSRNGTLLSATVSRIFEPRARLHRAQGQNDGRTGTFAP